jgi:hypothetical protein
MVPIYEESFEEQQMGVIKTFKPSVCVCRVVELAV